MTDRERLLQILNVPIHPHLDVDPLEAVADYLLDNGVTFATDNNVGNKWIPVSERLPENIGLFLVIEKHWIDGSPCRKIAKWNTVDWFTADRKSKEITPRVTHWMPLPNPPKEE